MDKKELLIETLKEMGFRPHVDENIVIFRYQLKRLFCVIEEGDSEDYICILYPNFYEISTEECPTALYVCNKGTRELRHIKLYLDDEMSNISASSEFFFCSKEELKKGVEKGLELIGIVGTWVAQTLAEISKEDKKAEEYFDENFDFDAFEEMMSAE